MKKVYLLAVLLFQFTYASYAQDQAFIQNIQTLLDLRTPNDFYRTHIVHEFTYNDPHLYNGIDFLKNMINDDVIKFVNGLGLSEYDPATPLTNAFLNIRYMINDKSQPNFDIHWKTAGQTNDFMLLENKYYLPLGFMVNENISGYVHDDNPFMSQNNLFRRATGFDADLFAVTELTDSDITEKDEGRGLAMWDYKVPSAGLIYTYFKNDGDSTHVNVYLNNELKYFVNISPEHKVGFRPIGYFQQDDIISIVTKVDVSSYLGLFNEELFEQGYYKLASQPLVLTEFTNNNIKGHVVALEDGLLYTSIPAKNWNVYVDSVEKEMVLIDGAMAAVRLNKGYREVEFRYINNLDNDQTKINFFNSNFVIGIVTGIAISLVLFGVIAFIVIRARNKRKKSA